MTELMLLEPFSPVKGLLAAPEDLFVVNIVVVSFQAFHRSTRVVAAVAPEYHSVGLDCTRAGAVAGGAVLRSMPWWASNTGARCWRIRLAVGVVIVDCDAVEGRIGQLRRRVREGYAFCTWAGPISSATMPSRPSRNGQRQRRSTGKKRTSRERLSLWRFSRANVLAISRSCTVAPIGRARLQQIGRCCCLICTVRGGDGRGNDNRIHDAEGHQAAFDQRHVGCSEELIGLVRCKARKAASHLLVSVEGIRGLGCWVLCVRVAKAVRRQWDE